MVEEALNTLSLLSDESKIVSYTYVHPDYGQMVKTIPDILMPLTNNSFDDDNILDMDDILEGCAGLDRTVLAEGISSLIYFWLDKWHHANENDESEDEDEDEDEDDNERILLYPLQATIVMAEHFMLRECLPALLEIERQDRNFAEAFFDDCDMVGLVPACIYQVAGEADLPMLADFVCERGIYTFNKAEVIATVSTLPRRLPQMLPLVQQWLCSLLEIFADHIDPEVGDVTLLEAIIHCCIHTRCEAAKQTILRMYSKYKMPKIMVPGGANEVRKRPKES